MNKWLDITTVNLDRLEILKITDCNLITSRFGLTLSEENVQQLIIARKNSLKRSGRIEFSRGIIEKIIFEFCDSPYITQNNYTSTLYDLIELFYYFKNISRDEISDDELITLMKKFYDEKCYGSIDLLQDFIIEYLEHNIIFE